MRGFLCLACAVLTLFLFTGMAMADTGTVLGVAASADVTAGPTCGPNCACQAVKACDAVADPGKIAAVRCTKAIRAVRSAKVARVATVAAQPRAALRKTVKLVKAVKVAKVVKVASRPLAALRKAQPVRRVIATKSARRSLRRCSR